MRFLIFVTFFILASASLLRAQEGISHVDLDRDSIFTVCDLSVRLPADYKRPVSEAKKDEARVKVSAFPDRDLDGQTYYYVPSTGKIIGKGAQVVWDLSEARPGTYSMTVGLGREGVLQGKTITKTVKVEEIPVCDPACWCPFADVRLPQTFIAVGDTFIAETTASDIKELRYTWSVTAGEILAGQGTTKILVRANKPGELKVSLHLDGTDPSCNCPTDTSNFIQVKNRP